MNKKTYAAFCELIYAKSGVRIHESKTPQVVARIKKRMLACGFASYKDYLQYLTNDDSNAEVEMKTLMDKILGTNEPLLYRPSRTEELFMELAKYNVCTKRWKEREY